MPVELLTLPLELRQEIYTQLLFSHPVPSETNQDVCIYEPIPDENGDKPDVKLLSPYRPCGYIPGAFQRACRQIYRECRATPFQQNEFVWAARRGASGSLPVLLDGWKWACLPGSALTFAKEAQCHWEIQRSCGQELVAARELWYVRMDVMQCLLMAYDESSSELRRVFDRWSDGVRLKVVEPEMEYADVIGWGDVVEKYSEDLADEKTITYFGDMRWCWVRNGLRNMKALRKLEVELDDSYPQSKFKKGGKVEWVRKLEKELNQRKKEEEKVRVVCVQRVVEELQEKEEESQEKKW